MITPQGLHRDANQNPLNLAEGVVVNKTKTFSNAAGSGAIGTVDLFTVTGTVLMKLFGICTTNMAGATATIEVGVAANTAGLIAQSTATDLIAGEVWLDATPTTKIEAYSNATQFIVGNSPTVILTVATANLTAGVIEFYCIYQPISASAQVVAA